MSGGDGAGARSKSNPFANIELASNPNNSTVSKNNGLFLTPQPTKGGGTNEMKKLNENFLRTIADHWEGGLYVNDYSHFMNQYVEMGSRIGPESGGGGGSAAAVEATVTGSAPAVTDATSTNTGTASARPASAAAKPFSFVGTPATAAPASGTFSFAAPPAASLAAPAARPKLPFSFGGAPAPAPIPPAAAPAAASGNDDDDATSNPDDGKVESVQAEENAEEEILYMVRANGSWKKYGAGILRLFKGLLPAARKQEVVWTREEDELLLKKVFEYRVQHDLGVDGAISWPAIARAFKGSKSSEDCMGRMLILLRIHSAGDYFATISEVWNPDEVERRSKKALDPDKWDSCKLRVCRDGAQVPVFDRRRKERDNREPKEFLDARGGALLQASTVAESVTTVNDDLIPSDIFGKTPMAADKAHLLPRSRNAAMTWQYPGCAVLGLDIGESVGTEVAKKAVLGGTDSTNPAKKYPGIRNFLCNIVRMSNQASFDQNPNVLIFPIYELDEAKTWAGEGYEAIVLCASASVAQRIGMTNVDLDDTNSARVADINKAVNLASEVCQFLAYSVLEKSEEDVNGYQSDSEEQAHKTFRTEREIAVPFNLLSVPKKPVFKIAFVGHQSQGGHPAPDPMLLAFKSGNNWCRRYAGFRMVAGAEPEELDDLSEEGQQNLLNYVAWQAAREKSLRHSDIMDRFGHEGAGIRAS